MAGRRRVGWRLTLEPIGLDRAAFSLLRVDDHQSAKVVCARSIHGLTQVHQFATSLQAGTGPHAGVRRNETGPTAVHAGPLADAEAERWLAVRLGLTLLPAELSHELLHLDGQHERHTVTVAARGWMARIPWEILALDATGDVRLIERAQVTAGISPLVTAQRRHPTKAARPGTLRVVDPGPRVDPELRPLYPGGYPAAWFASTERGPHDQLLPDGLPYDADDFGTSLRREGGWERLLFMGHALPGSAHAPAGAALVLSDAHGRRRLSAHAWLREPDLWPAPRRVALIACGSEDQWHVEQSGLPMAAINAGAELLTASRWSLPMDVDPPRSMGTTQLALAVDAAHAHPDPLAAMRDWQLGRLNDWRRDPQLRNSPLLWASVATYALSPHESPGESHD